MKKTMLLLFALMLSSAICAQDYHVVLWDNTTAPTSNGLSGDEVESKPGQWKNTQTAEMWIYKAGDNATGQALVFFPGGGYSSESSGRFTIIRPAATSTLGTIAAVKGKSRADL